MEVHTEFGIAAALPSEFRIVLQPVWNGIEHILGTAFVRISEGLDVPVLLHRVEYVEGRKFLGYAPSAPYRELVGEFELGVEARGQAADIVVGRAFHHDIFFSQTE